MRNKNNLTEKEELSLFAVDMILHVENPKDTEGGNRQNRLHLESRTPSWAGLWTLSYMPSIYGNDIPTGKPDPQDGKAPGLKPRLSVA